MELRSSHSLLEMQVEFISVCIASCADQLQLQTCERMIRERVDCWGLWDQSELLRRQILVRTCEIIAGRYTEE